MVQTRKRELRQEMKVVLANLDPRWKSAGHTEVCGNLTSFVRECETGKHGIGKFDAVLAWIPAFPGEVDLATFIATMLRTYPVFLPQIDSFGAMQFVRIDHNWATRLKDAEYGILQPDDQHSEKFEPTAGLKSLIVTPGLAFDRSGGRLGRGKGHYDRFLDSVDIADSTLVAACWSMQILPSVPVESHDHKVQWICHERECIAVERV